MAELGQWWRQQESDKACPRQPLENSSSRSFYRCYAYARKCTARWKCVVITNARPSSARLPVRVCTVVSGTQSERHAWCGRVSRLGIHLPAQRRRPPGTAHATARGSAPMPTICRHGRRRGRRAYTSARLRCCPGRRQTARVQRANQKAWDIFHTHEPNNQRTVVIGNAARPAVS